MPVRMTFICLFCFGTVYLTKTCQVFQNLLRHCDTVGPWAGSLGSSSVSDGHLFHIFKILKFTIALVHQRGCSPLAENIITDY